MSYEERSYWQGLLLSIWGAILITLMLVAFLGTDKGHGPEFQQGLGWAFLVSTISWLLALSWRGAYLSGKNS